MATTVRRRLVLGLGLVAAATLTVPMARAQGEVGALLEGRVADSAGIPLAGADVTVISAALPSGEATLLTDDVGAFRLGPLEAGLYDVLVLLDGFRRGELRDVRVDAGRAARVEITLERRTSGGY